MAIPGPGLKGQKDEKPPVLSTQAVYINKTGTIRGGYTTLGWDTFDPAANPTTPSCFVRG